MADWVMLSSRQERIDELQDRMNIDGDNDGISGWPSGS